MIGKYKIIALCTCRIQDDECHKFITAFHRRLSEIGCRLFVYTCCSDILEGREQNDGQTSIFGLINASFVDAVILQADRIKNRNICRDIIDSAHRSGIPVMVLGGRFSGCLNIEYDYRAGFAEAVKHLIDVHGITDMHMIAGVKGNSYSEDRIEMFREVLEQHDIPFSDDMVSYGDFWSIPAVEAAQKLIESGKLPRAIVCANDHMAIAVVNHLKDNGISVPEDVAVTGFDGISTIYSSEPTITSIEISDDSIAKVICDSLTEVFKGGSCEGEITVMPRPILNESCGCSSDKKINSAALLNEEHNCFYRFQDENIIMSAINKEIQKCSSFEEIAFVMRENDLMYAMCCLIKQECTDESADPEKIREQGFGDKLFLLYDSDMIDYMALHGERFSPYDMPADEIIPTMDYYLDDGRSFIFAAMYHLDVPLGYVCFHFSDYVSGNFYKIPQTVDMLNNALGGLRSQRHQHYLLRQIDEMYRIDVLTGLYNRRGFHFEYDRLLEETGDGPLTVVMCDLDGLKYINDNFGHEEGDSAISTAAKALRHACPPDAVCMRFGGDEMLAVCRGRVEDSGLRDKAGRYLAEHNAKSGKPYTVSASIGIYHTSENERLTFEELIKRSDGLMYEEKRRRKAEQL
ncbi:MAG: GGDEF domain-containing protein [Oscillospiraceae bacterium]|nr:GGDEF domain-containing protein [Oscillospiraceae bacterium]